MAVHMRKDALVPLRSAKEKAQDDLVMSTNSSSIVSKRSVERIYYPNEPHFFRFFVKKFQRRAPLINRGYYLRLHVIDSAVRQFLERPCEKTKVVINLGCGSDVLPWQCMTRYPDACRGVKFIDIDFPDLMSKKQRIVRETPELSSVLTGLESDVDDRILLKSDQYFQLGCDLRDLAGIEKALSTFLDIADCAFMFVAEVSITYMETESADSVIRWAASLGQADFCLLEQILPDGADHPFAKTMLSHFEKLKTPLKSVFTYPSLKSQRDRFRHLGWSNVDVESLWQTWTNNARIPASKRRELDAVEPFDEWEEFVLFAAHYCVVIADTAPESTKLTAPKPTSTPEIKGPRSFASTFFNKYHGTLGHRRFGATVKTRSFLGDEALINMLGLGTKNRLKTCDIYSNGPLVQGLKIGQQGPSSRMCHVTVDLGHFGSLLAGGRTSPTAPLRDCWHFSLEGNTWSRVEDLPLPLYRHSMTRLGRSNMVLLLGGKSDSSCIFGGSMIYKPGSGWLPCDTTDSNHQPTFGATLVSFDECEPSTADAPRSEDSVIFRGIMMGGMNQDGVVSTQTLAWTLELPAAGKPTISFSILPGSKPNSDIVAAEHVKSSELLGARFGASALPLDGYRIVLIGGVTSCGIVPQNEEILVLDMSGHDFKVDTTCSFSSSQLGELTPRPLLVGVSTALTESGHLVVMGGGATCFSMGTYWNGGCYSARHSFKPILEGGLRSPYLKSEWRYRETVEITEESRRGDIRQDDCQKRSVSLTEIPRVRIASPAAFEEVLKAGKPVIFEESNLGPCVTTWSAETLVDRVGQDREVVVHEAKSANMDFKAKNFAYATREFGRFMSEVASGGKLYLRALSRDSPSNQPAQLETDFPTLANDFQLPDELGFIKENTFSSVLRISGPVNMWLHYDVMANVYCQVTGSKRAILFPPSDVAHLPFEAGASSSGLDVFSALESQSLASTHPHEATLNSGDVLFIPPCWLHTTASLTNLGVAVNVFFRSLESGYSSGRDVYGNRDIAAYEKGRQDIKRIADTFGRVPQDMREFYVRRLADELALKVVE
ncbi:leucine carboxyl methyltransferase [Xylariaceae sp. FL0804]|nr:leucine carboxyl methyltransferase [Xylariaceae sp. FL0804]